MVLVLIFGCFMIQTYTSNDREAISFCKYSNFILTLFMFNYFL